MIKVKLPFRYKCLDGENVWVIPLSNDTGEISNLPFFATKYKYKDIIKFDPETWESLEKLADGGFTRTKVYPYTGIGYNNHHGKINYDVYLNWF